MLNLPNLLYGTSFQDNLENNQCPQHVGKNSWACTAHHIDLQRFQLFLLLFPCSDFLFPADLLLPFLHSSSVSELSPPNTCRRSCSLRFVPKKTLKLAFRLFQLYNNIPLIPLCPVPRCSSLCRSSRHCLTQTDLFQDTFVLLPDLSLQPLPELPTASGTTKKG